MAAVQYAFKDWFFLFFPFHIFSCFRIQFWIFDWFMGLSYFSLFRNGTYVTAIGSLKEFKGKRQFGAFSVR